MPTPAAGRPGIPDKGPSVQARSGMPRLNKEASQVERISARATATEPPVRGEKHGIRPLLTAKFRVTCLGLPGANAL